MRGAIILDSVKFAVAWAVASFGLFCVLVLSVFSGWSTSDKVSLFQAFVGIAGFGAGLVLLLSAVARQLGEGDPET